MTAVACFVATIAWLPYVNNDIDLEPNKLGRDLGQALGAAFRPPIIDRDGATFTVREMKVGPSRPAVRFWPQTGAASRPVV
jgi:hypothetical protein